MSPPSTNSKPLTSQQLTEALIKRVTPVLLSPDRKKLFHTRPDDAAEWTLAETDVDVEWTDDRCSDGFPITAQLTPTESSQGLLADLMRGSNSKVSDRLRNSKTEGFDWSVRCPLRYTHFSEADFIADPALFSTLPSSIDPAQIGHAPRWFNDLPAQEVDMTSEPAVRPYVHSDPVDTIAKYRATVKVASYDPALSAAEQGGEVSLHGFMADCKISQVGGPSYAMPEREGPVIIALTMYPVRQVHPQSSHDPSDDTPTYADHLLSGKTTLWKLSSTHTGADYKASLEDLQGRETTETGVLSNGLTGGQGRDKETVPEEDKAECPKDWHEYDQIYRSSDGSLYQVQRATLTTLGARINEPKKGKLSVVLRRVDGYELPTNVCDGPLSRSEWMAEAPFLTIPLQPM